MTLVNIDLRNQGYETSPGDKVIFYSLLVREGDFGTISTAPVEVPLVDGKATVDLAPGPVGVQIIAGQVADTRVKEGRVPMEGPTTLNVVLTLLPEYSDAVRASFLAAIRGAQDEALTRIDAEVAVAVDAEMGGVTALSEEALSRAKNAEGVAATADAKSTSATSTASTAISTASNAATRVTALEAMSGLSPESPVDGQTANLVLQETTLTRGALEEAYASESLASARAQKKLTGKKMALVLRHDDVQKNALQYLPLYDELGVKASWYVATAQMGETHRGILMANAQDIINLHHAGHEIGSHTQTHLYFDQATEAQRRAELAGSKRDLEALLGGGYRCETFAYPGNWGNYEREVGDYYIWGTSGVQNLPDHGGTHTLAEIDTVSNRAEYPDPLMGSTVAETIAKTKSVLAGYKSREALTIYTLQTHNLNEVPLDHMRAILETVIADPDAEVVTMREAAYYVRASLLTRDGRFYAPYGVTTGSTRQQVSLRGDSHQSGGHIVDRQTTFGRAYVAKVDGTTVANLDSNLELLTSGTSRLERGHRLAMYSPGNAENVNMGVEAGGILTVNLTGGATEIRARGKLRINGTGKALQVYDTSGTNTFEVDATNRTLWVRSLPSLPATSATGEICNLNGTFFICTLGGSPGRWEPVGVKSGTTAQRPTGAAVVTGVSYFDTTIGKPIWWNGTAWVDATGAAA